MEEELTRLWGNLSLTEEEQNWVMILEIEIEATKRERRSLIVGSIVAEK
jgi:hypothetical protein